MSTAHGRIRHGDEGGRAAAVISCVSVCSCLPFLLRAQSLNVLDDVVALKNTAGAEDELDELDAVVVCGERGIGSENCVRYPFDHGLVEVEKLVDNEAAG